MLLEAGKSSKVTCIDVGVPILGEMFNSFMGIAQQSCEKVASHPDLQGDFNVVGLSQGSLLGRYIVEDCKMNGKVRNLLTMGGPNMGGVKVPRCFDSSTKCNFINFFAKGIAFLPFFQHWFPPATYYRDP